MKIINSIKSFFSKKEILLIENEKKFDLIVPTLKESKFIGLDTEFIWKNTYYPKLSLLQISTKNIIFILDCLKLNNLESLNEILEIQISKRFFTQ